VTVPSSDAGGLPLDLDQIEARVATDERIALNALHPDAVSPGHWTYGPVYTGSEGEPHRVDIAEDRKGHYWHVISGVWLPIAEHMTQQSPEHTLESATDRRALVARVRALEAEVQQLREQAEASALSSIEGWNPGIDMDEVRRMRGGGNIQRMGGSDV
jgi:hypothetical protein